MKNLIKVLGGYELTNNWYKENKDKDWVGVFHVETVKNSLLEYRREHEIYEAGDQVFVDFISSNKVESDGTQITGSGVIDRVDPDGFLYGRLNDGGYFGCPSSDVKHEK